MQIYPGERLEGVEFVEIASEGETSGIVINNRHYSGIVGRKDVWGDSSWIEGGGGRILLKIIQLGISKSNWNTF